MRCLNLHECMPATVCVCVYGCNASLKCLATLSINSNNNNETEAIFGAVKEPRHAMRESMRTTTTTLAACQPGTHTHTPTCMHTHTHMPASDIGKKSLCKLLHFIAVAKSEESSSLLQLQLVSCFTLHLSTSVSLFNSVFIASSPSGKSVSLAVRGRWHAPTAYQILLSCKLKMLWQLPRLAPSLSLTLLLLFSCSALLPCALPPPPPLCLPHLTFPARN